MPGELLLLLLLLFLLLLLLLFPFLRFLLFSHSLLFDRDCRFERCFDKNVCFLGLMNMRPSRAVDARKTSLSNLLNYF